MEMGAVRAIARQWVDEEVGSRPDFRGAYLAGSITALPDDAPLPAASDVDIKVILDGPDVPGEPQKCRYRDIVLDISYGSSKDVMSPEAVLGSYFTAVHFTHPCIVSDPSGDLAAIQTVVEREYARREWVRRRCEDALQQLRVSLTWLNPTGPIHDQVFAWLLPIFFTPPMVLVADLRNPTHRRGMATLAQILARHGRPELHERVLGIVGSATLSREDVEMLLTACAEAFDVAQAARSTPFLMASNISEFARPMAIGGARELIDGGHHREAVPWITFIHTMCHIVLQNDARTDIQERFAPKYDQLLRALGVSTYDALAARRVQIDAIIPDLWHVAEEIIATNPSIRD